MKKPGKQMLSRLFSFLASTFCRNNGFLELVGQASVQSAAQRVRVAWIVALLESRTLVGERRCFVKQVLHAQRDIRVLQAGVAARCRPGRVRAYVLRVFRIDLSILVGITAHILI